VKASAFRRWPVTAPYRGEQTTRLTGGHDFFNIALNILFVYNIDINIKSIYYLFRIVIKADCKENNKYRQN
jgi:hypothetical protein